jgi:NAD(P)-dependent dehydrogenase (short-subunit alcohol dehydrogenase family)
MADAATAQGVDLDRTPIPDYARMCRLDGRTLVVVGAGQGIGRQTAAALAGCGASVVCVDIRPELAHAVAEEVGGSAWVGDVTDRSEVDRLVVEVIARSGRVHGFVDIVGMAHYADALAIDDERWAWQFDIVLRHAFLLSQSFGRAMRSSGGGTMVFVCSISGLLAAPQTAAYGAAKAGLISWIRSLADELGPVGIRVNGVAPGMVWTRRVSGLIGEPGRHLVDEATPLRRMAVPSDIAAAALFLTSDLSAFVTGQTLVVDGGITNRFPYPMDELARISGVSSRKERA